jgi:heme exporter protein A
MRLSGSNLACVRGGREVFAGVAFGVGAGEALMVTGPNGAGKSSLLRLVAGLVAVAAGKLALEGGDGELTIGEQAHYVGHQDALKSSLTVQENLTFWVDVLGGGAPPVAAALASGASGQRGDSMVRALASVGLADLAHLPARYLSAGQRRRLSIARLVAVSRPIWLLDEPTSALDASAQGMLADLMRGHLVGGGLILAAAHGPIGLDSAMELRLGASQ